MFWGCQKLPFAAAPEPRVLEASVLGAIFLPPEKEAASKWPGLPVAPLVMWAKHSLSCFDPFELAFLSCVTVHQKVLALSSQFHGTGTSHKAEFGHTCPSSSLELLTNKNCGQGEWGWQGSHLTYHDIRVPPHRPSRGEWSQVAGFKSQFLYILPPCQKSHWAEIMVLVESHSF